MCEIPQAQNFCAQKFCCLNRDTFESDRGNINICVRITGISWASSEQTDRVVTVPRLDFWVHSSLPSEAPTDAAMITKRWALCCLSPWMFVKLTLCLCQRCLCTWHLYETAEHFICFEKLSFLSLPVPEGFSSSLATPQFPLWFSFF